MKIIVGTGSCGLAAGARKVTENLTSLLTSADNIKVGVTGCIGMCFLEPIVDIYDGEDLKCRLTLVGPDNAEAIVNAARTKDYSGVASLMIKDEDKKFLDQQTRIALRNCGIIDPTDINAYIATGGYDALKKSINAMTPEEVIAEVKNSGLGGRGGAGFSTGLKWTFCRNAPGEQKYFICNADEGDPGAFMDRAVLESDPHTILEGMLIACYAIGASEGIIYVRAEYPLAIVRLAEAIKQAEEAGFIGNNILGSDFSCHIRIKAGAGAFVCGEETALMESLQGNRGMPRLKPPFPATSGYNYKPTNINNVETIANVPWILFNGGDKFAAMGTEGSKGTKVFALTGKIKNGGLVEIPMGMTLRQVIYDIGGGIRGDKEFKAVQLGGPSGGCIPASKLDTLIDYKALVSIGAMMGSGGMVVMDETTCVVDVAKFFLDFTAKESCGKCVPCRIGTKRMLEALTRITEGKGKVGDVELLEELATTIKDGALCGLGQTAPNPVLTTIRYFRDEYDAHIVDKKCPAKACKALITYSIDADKCVGCTLCARNCPVDAISGVVKKVHTIDQEICIKCGKCLENCKFGAVIVE